MVQISDHKDNKGSKDWWKLDSGKRHGAKALLQILRDNSYSHKSKSKSVARLRALYVRCQRGLMTYEGQPIRELKLYLTQRGFPVVDQGSKAILKEQLEQADEDVTFRLCDLPPELRSIIFSYYFDSVVEFNNARLKHQPPISCVSRMLRRETLPLFFERFAFTFECSQHADRLVSGTERYMYRTTAHSFALIRHFTVWNGWDMKLTVDFHKNNKFSFELTPPWNKRDNGHLSIQERVSAAIDSLLKEIVARGEVRNLRATDIEALRYILEGFDKPLHEKSDVVDVVPTQSVVTYSRPARKRSMLLWDIGRSRRTP